MKLAALVLLAAPAFAGVDLDVVVDGAPRAEYVHRGATYIEAIRGRDYSLRLTNPTGNRVAVALSVDGLNTIDAKHTDGWSASKWVIEPYDSIEISGWQVSGSTARRFIFTGERRSYGAALGQTENLGVIEAIFYRERRRPIAQRRYERYEEEVPAPAPAPSASAEGQAAPRSQAKEALSDDYAATGMGGRTRHDVTEVDLDLDPHPIASVRLRYEFRPALVKLGVLMEPSRSPLQRRERARGFEGYCPEP